MFLLLVIHVHADIFMSYLDGRQQNTLSQAGTTSLGSWSLDFSCTLNIEINSLTPNAKSYLFIYLFTDTYKAHSP